MGALVPDYSRMQPSKDEPIVTLCLENLVTLWEGQRNTWNGYLVFGASNYDLNYCSTQCQLLTQSGTCVSGGNGDVSRRGEPIHVV